jgi:hypothetical protein
MGMNNPSTQKLLTLASGFAVAQALSYVTTRLFFPSLFPYWGRTLIILLGLWSASSSWILLRNASRSMRSLVLFLLTVALITGCSFAWGGLVGLLLVLSAIVVLFLTMLLIGVLERFEVSLSPRWLLTGFLPLLIGTLLIGIINLKPAPSAIPTQSMSINEELRYLYEMDQVDRKTGRFILDATRDQIRLERVLVLDQRQITAPEAQYHAAMLLQHGTCPHHFQRAHELAESAARANIPNAKSLAHASYDRWMLSIHQPQKYNTQWLVNQPACNTAT